MPRVTPAMVALLGALCVAGTLPTRAAESLPRADAPFGGKISINEKDSTPAWPQPLKAPAEAPNVILVLLDDVGFGASSAFGGPTQTPAIEQLASQGLRYTGFNTTALCSPTRAALLTGRNHHRVGFGTVVEIGSGYPGYNGVWKRSTASVAEVLRQNGYNTAAFGKWHNTPSNEISPVGPFDRWPTGVGFEYFYGFMGGETTQFETPLYRNTTAVDPKTRPEQGYHLTTDLTNDAIDWLHTHESIAPTKPYFLYFATGAAHAPLHVPKEWVDKYRGKFDQGWDKLREETFARQKKLGILPANAKLTPRPRELPGWAAQSPGAKRLFARQMEVYAAFLAHTDHEIGRLLDAARAGPNGDNTIVVYIVGDNGASAEGGLEGSENNLASFFMGVPDDLETQESHIDDLGSVKFDNHYATAWAWATTAPFQWTKQVASHFGGTRNGLVISWPAKIRDKGGVRSQFSHVTDIAPTLYEAIGIKLPGSVNGTEQQPVDGTSLLYTFTDAAAPTRHRLQYFEMLGNRALYKDGWVAAARHSLPWDSRGRSEDFTQDTWELYHVDEDYSEAHDLAKRYPDKLKALQVAFDEEARKNDVYPFSNGINASKGIGAGIPSLTDGRKQFVYYGGTPRLPASATPTLLGSHRITARLVVPQNAANGLIVSGGSRYGGYALYAKGGKLVYQSNFFGKQYATIESTTPLPAGPVEVAFDFTREDRTQWGGGTGRLLINGQPAGEGKLAKLSSAFIGSFDIGEAHLSPVGNGYELPFRFNGSVEKVTIDLK